MLTKVSCTMLCQDIMSLGDRKLWLQDSQTDKGCHNNSRQTKIWRALRLLNIRVFLPGNFQKMNEKKTYWHLHENTCRKKYWGSNNREMVHVYLEQNLSAVVRFPRTKLIKSKIVLLSQDFNLICTYEQMQIKKILIYVYTNDLISDMYNTPFFSPPQDNNVW